MPTGEIIAKECARSAEQIGAERITVLDLRGISTIADYFVICTGTSMPHLKAIHRDIDVKVEEALEERPRAVEGKSDSMWMILDYVDVIVHIFHKEMRDIYSLEDLWSDAPRITYDFLPEEGTVPETDDSEPTEPTIL